jgi:alpha-amylase/alpha-mannosidase (GH57 family)
MTRAAEQRLTLVLLWHMHQPEYRDYASGEFRLPWVYLHALKDYSDMAWHLENHPGVHAVVNFTPVLLEQLEDYAEQFKSGKLRDPLLRLLTRPAGEPVADDERELILERCFPPEHADIAQPFAAYESLHALYRTLRAQEVGSHHHLSDQYFYDLLVWHHLRWTGETVRRASPIVTRLMAIGTRFSHADRKALFDLIADVVGGVLPRYARLAASGSVEVSTTPHHHPLAPLLISFESAREAMPGVALPASPGYPGGFGRVRSQLESALAAHASRFGAPPAGIWPAEGAISKTFLELIAASGCAWAASSAQVLRNGLQDASHYRTYRFNAGARPLTLFFRDERLSDLIGFEYRKWNSHDAAANMITELEAIAGASGNNEPPVVSVMLDGENCWGHYAYNGYYFLTALYKALESHARIRTATCSEVLRDPPAAPPVLERVVAGSWVHGNFSTWIGVPEKNRAWDLLCSAKQTFDVVVASGRLSEPQLAAAYRQLGACEASDAFWWLGSANSAATVRDFDKLFRAELAQLYRVLALPVPEALAQPIGAATRGRAGEGEGAMRRSLPA